MPFFTDHIRRPAVFGPEEISVLSEAYDFVLRSFPTPPPQREREAIAAGIIAVACSGARDPRSSRALYASNGGLMNTYQQQAIDDFNSFAVTVCPLCHMAMRLFGIEHDAIGSELLSFECAKCERIETRTDRCQ